MFVITTTNEIEGFVVEKYFGYVYSNIVRGLNFLSDTSAALTSILGGRNVAIEEQLNKSLDENVRQIKEKALCLGANAILLFIIQYEFKEYSSGMLLVVGSYGTAVKLRPSTDTVMTDIPIERITEREVF